MTRRLMGQDFRELSEQLDFMCPMAYHLSAGKKLEWVGQVSRFMSRLSRRSCRIYPTVQAYYEFVTQITVSTRSVMPGKPTQALMFEVSLDGTLRFEAVWRSPKNRFSLEVREPSSQIILPDRYNMRIRESTTESFTLRVCTKGSWTVELVTDLLSSYGDTVTVRVSDLNQEFPGYVLLRAAISVVLAHCGGFCVYALNDLSTDEFNAIRECSGGNFTIECISLGYLCGRLRQSMLSRTLFLPTYHGRLLNHLLRREAPRLSTFQNDSHLWLS